MPLLINPYKLIYCFSASVTRVHDQNLNPFNMSEVETSNNALVHKELRLVDSLCGLITF